MERWTIRKEKTTRYVPDYGYPDKVTVEGPYTDGETEVITVERVSRALEKVYPGGCREWIDEKHNRCGAPAEFVLWGKLFEPEALGPRCYDHAAKHVGHAGLGDPSYAIIDLRPLIGLLEGARGKRLP